MLMIMWLSAPLPAQTGAGAIQGTVHDASGALVPKATVKAVHLATSVAQETVTNEAGFYTFPQAPIGRYRINVQASGMSPWEAEVAVLTGQTAVVDASLAVGTSVSTVTVAGDVTALVTENSPVIGQVLERSRIEQLPLNGRSFSTLLSNVTAGAEGTRINGLWDAAFEVMQDGAVLRNLDTASLPQQPPGLDTIQEFRVETSTSSARFDRPTTSIISTRSGTNSIHGSAFETARNSAIGVARRRQDSFTKAPHLVRNEFGASIGGPVEIPKLYHGRNKTFFFVAFEGLRNRQGATTSTTVFPDAWRHGDFSGLTDSDRRLLTLYDPFSTQSRANNWARTPFPNNVIPANLESPVAKYIYSVTPLPTLPAVNPQISSNYFGPGINNSTNNTTTVRIDHTFSEKNHFFGRYSKGSTDSSSPPTSSSGPPTLDRSTNLTNRQGKDQSAVLSLNHTFSPTFFSETNVAVSYEDYNIYTGDFFNDWSGKLGLPNPFQGQGFPKITNTGVNFTFIQGDTRRQNKSLVGNIDQHFTKIVRKHELQFGGRFRDDRAHVLPDQQFASGNFSFASLATGLYDPTSGSSYGAVPQTDFAGADFFLGVAGSYADRYNPKTYQFAVHEYAGYIQDNWRVSSRLTLNLGMRYEYFPPLRDKTGLLQGFDLQNMAIVNDATLDDLYKRGRTTPQIVSTFTTLGVKFETASEAGRGSGLISPYHKDFGPRVGFAWKAFGGSRPLILRGGFGLYDYSPPLRNFDASTRSNPPFNANFTTSYTAAASSPDGLPNYSLRSVPAVIAGVNSAGAVNPVAPGSITPGSFTVVYFPSDYPDTRAADWNLTAEREIMANTVARVSYVGTHSWNLEQDSFINQAPNAYVWYVTTGQPLPTGTFASTATRNHNQTTYGDLEQYGKTGWSNSNGLQLQMERRYAKGYAFQFFYVLNNAFRVGGNGFRDGLMQEPNVFLPGSVPADFDARNRFLFYSRDTAIPKHRVRWNWLVDLPFGKGKPVLGNAGPWMNRLVGGWQLAGFGTWKSNYWSLPTSNYGQLGDVQVYGLKYPIEDCRSGQCIPGYLYWNGYIPANQINTHNAAGQCNGICGVPADYKPSSLPVIPFPATAIPNDPNAPFYGTNTVYVPLKNGTLQRTTINPNMHPWQNQYVNGPGTFGLDASIFKNIPITERVFVRINADFFSVLNNPGLSQPGSNGILSLQSSANAARTMQLSMRLTW
jgi:hypothetical protein